MTALPLPAPDTAPQLRLVEPFDFDAWYAVHGGRLHALARRAARNPADADDIAQAAALHVHRNGGWDRPLGLLVRHYAGHAARAAVARQARETTAAAERPTSAPAELPDDVAELIAARVADPRDRAVAALLSEGRNGREVAQVLGLGEMTVSRAIERLRRLFAQDRK